MKSSRTTRNLGRLVMLCAALVTLAALSSARTATTSVTIVNNSGKEIRNLYLSHVNSDDWSDNQLGSTTISSGQSFTLSNVVCDQSQVKLIGENQDGCFYYTVVNCGENATWTITAETPADCGN
jgi:hypothetical protein